MDAADTVLRGSTDMPEDGVITGCMMIAIYAMPDEEVMMVHKSFGFGMNHFARRGVVEEVLDILKESGEDLPVPDPDEGD